MATTEKSDAINPIERFALAGFSAALSKTAAAPIERVKLLIQNQDELIKASVLDRRYRGIGDCFKRTYQKEGALSFFRGNLPNILRYFPTQSLNFVFKDISQKIVPKPSSDNKLAETGYYIASGGIAGSLSLSLVYSLDYVRTRLANDLKSTKTGGGQRQYKGILDCYSKTFKSDGLAGLYRGFCVSCVGIFVYRGLYFGLYDSYKSGDLRKSAIMQNPIADFAMAYGITVGSGLLSYPIDTIRRRMMMTSGQAVKYSSSLDCLAQIIKKEGARSLFKGAAANVMRGLAGAGVLFFNDKITDLYVSLR